MLSAVSPSTAGLSSLELMLESLRKRDEQSKDIRTKDIPPALPTRPLSRARRLPTARRTSFIIDDSAKEDLPNDSKEKEEKEEDQGLRRAERVSGSKRVSSGSIKIVHSPSESPCVRKPGDGENYGDQDTTDPDSNLVATPSTLPQSREEPELQKRHNISHFLKKKLRAWCGFSTSLKRLSSPKKREKGWLLWFGFVNNKQHRILHKR